MTSLAQQMVDMVKEKISSEFLAVVTAFNESEGDTWSPDKMERLQAEIAKIAVPAKPKKATTTIKAKAVKTADMSVRCQGCDWKGGKIQNAWCKKDGEHTFQVDGETVKCCDKHFKEWEKADEEQFRLDGRVGFALAKAHNRRGSVRFMGFFGVSATNPARRPPIFPGEHYATISGTPDWDSFTKKSGDMAMDAASEEPEGKNGKFTGGVYMPSGGWVGAAESVKLDNDEYQLTTNTPTAPPTDDLPEDPELVDESTAPKQTDESGAPKRTDESTAPKQDERRATSWRGEDKHFSRNQDGDVYVSEEIIQWVQSETEAENLEWPDPDFARTLTSAPWGTYDKVNKTIKWVGQAQEAVDTFMDLGSEDVSDDGSDAGGDW